MCGCTKKSGATILSNIANAKYDFVNDSDFVLVQSVSKYIKEIKTKTMSVSDFVASYGIRSYGLVAYGTQFYILESDFNYYTNNYVQGVELELVNPVPEADVKIIIEDVEPEVAMQEVSESDNIVVQELGVELSDFTRIKGVGPVSAGKLNEMGFNTFTELLNITLEQWESMSPFNNEENYLEFLEKVENIILE